jgi:hypothetical protein
MKVTARHKAIHIGAIVKWFARRRKTTVQKVLLDLVIDPPSRIPDDVYYHVTGKRTYAQVMAGTGDVRRFLNTRLADRDSEMIGNVFSGESLPSIETAHARRPHRRPEKN